MIEPKSASAKVPAYNIDHRPLPTHGQDRQPEERHSTHQEPEGHGACTPVDAPVLHVIERPSNDRQEGVAQEAASDQGRDDAESLRAPIRASDLGWSRPNALGRGVGPARACRLHARVRHPHLVHHGKAPRPGLRLSPSQRSANSPGRYSAACPRASAHTTARPEFPSRCRGPAAPLPPTPRVLRSSTSPRPSGW